ATTRAVSFDNLVSEVEHAGRDSEAERLGGLEVDDQGEFRRLLNGEVGRTGALEDAVDVGCRLHVPVDYVDPVGHQAASSRQLRLADLGQAVTGRCGDDHIAMGGGETLRKTDQAASWLACMGGDGCFDPRVVVHRSKRYRDPEGR